MRLRVARKVVAEAGGGRAWQYDRDTVIAATRLVLRRHQPGARVELAKALGTMFWLSTVKGMMRSRLHLVRRVNTARMRRRLAALLRGWR